MKTVASMGLPASTVFPSTSNFRITHFHGQPCQLQRSLRLRARRQTSPTCSMKASMAEFGEPKKVNMQISILREKLWEAVPDSVKEIPWKKAEKTLMERLLFLGQKALKWTLIVLFVFSSLSDVIFSISSNQELMIPLGLFVGCLMTDFLKEISHELFRNSEEKRLNWQFMGIGCFFVLMKFLSANFLIRSRVFLLHFANGGLMQLLWLWRSLPEER
ncbi:hypothetical protein FH972_013722 [Carpinus fangiana]|uniref:Uncharacterized protein n=1 Tax=Carpinus fangiana TaxID=176857 RepID=A0A5N6RB00_9ROSI|nr:hypothetical protein FH972_013722 [Carpinus fangiana]